VVAGEVGKVIYAFRGGASEGKGRQGPFADKGGRRVATEGGGGCKLEKKKVENTEDITWGCVGRVGYLRYGDLPSGARTLEKLVPEQRCCHISQAGSRITQNES